MRILVVIAAALAVAASSASAASSLAASSVERQLSLENDILGELNRVRAEHNLQPLRSVRGLRVPAAAHSRSMLQVGFFDHASADGTSFDKRLRAHYSDRGWQMWSVGETLLATSQQLDPRRMVMAWIKSKSHRAIILSPTWQDVGIGAHYSAAPPAHFDPLPTIVVTADFGVRAGKESGPNG